MFILFIGAAKRAALKARQMAAAAAAAAALEEDDGNATDVDNASLPEDGMAVSGRKQSKTAVARKPSGTESVASIKSAEIPVIKISGETEASKSKVTAGPSKPPVAEKKQRLLKALIQAGKVRH